MERLQVPYSLPYPAGTTIFQSVAAVGGKTELKTKVWRGWQSKLISNTASTAEARRDQDPNGSLQRINLRYYYYFVYSVIYIIESDEIYNCLK